MKISAWLSFTACGFGLFLSGCGGITGRLRLLVRWLGIGCSLGRCRRLRLQFPPATGFRPRNDGSMLTAITSIASGYADVPCQPASSSPPPILETVSFSTGISGTGSVAADGSFSVQTPANFPGGSISIQGNAPQTNDGRAWSGSYTESLSALIGPPCTMRVLQERLQRPHFLLIDGVYVGTGSTLDGVNGVTKAVLSDGSDDSEARRNSGGSGERESRTFRAM